MNAAFDVGADDGYHGILFAFLNPKIKVFAFEPIKGSKKQILKNLHKVENFFNIKINNYKIINSAISDFNGSKTFYEANYKVGSSLLKPKKKLDKFWTESKDLLIKEVSKGIKMKKKYKVKVLTLERFCKSNSIKIINYLHIDAQGNDLRVINSLKKYKKFLLEGVVEVPKNNKLKIYVNEHTYKDLKKKFKLWKFKITNIEEVQKNYPSLNIYFKNMNSYPFERNNIIFRHPKKRLERLFKRIFLERTNIKDLVYLFFWKFKNKTI